MFSFLVSDVGIIMQLWTVDRLPLYKTWIYWKEINQGETVIKKSQIIIFRGQEFLFKVDYLWDR